MEASIDSGRDTMGTMSTTTTTTWYNRNRPLRVFNNGETNHMYTQPKNLNYQHTIPEKEGYNDRRTPTTVLQRHPPSPPVRLRDCSTDKASIHSSENSSFHNSQTTSVHQDLDNVYYKKQTNTSHEFLKKLSGFAGMDLQYDKLQAVADLEQLKNPHVGPSPWGEQATMHYDAKSYQDRSQTNVVSNKQTSDTVARKLDMDFQHAGKSRDASPISTASSGRSVGHIDLELTVASKDSQNSSFSSNSDKRPIMYRRLASTDLDVSLEHERKGKTRVNGTDDQSPRSDKEDYQRCKRKDKYLSYNLSKSTPDLQKLGQDGVSYTAPDQNTRGYGDSESVARTGTAQTGVGHQTASSLCKSNPALHEKSTSKEYKTNKGLGLPLNASRLRAIRQKTRNAVVNILEDGDVCLEFLKSKDGQEKVVEVFRISANGQKIEIFQPNSGKGCAVSSRPPAIPPKDQVKSYSFADLPPKYRKRYDYAARFVRLVRSKTPKVTMYTKHAKCMLMENSPSADFEVNFYNGAKFSITTEGTRIIEKDGTTLTLDSSACSSHLAPATRQLYHAVQDCHNRCLELHSLVQSMEKGDVSYFPITLGRRPAASTVTADDKNATPRTNNAQNNRCTAAAESTYSPSTGPSPATLKSFDGTIISQVTNAATAVRQFDSSNSSNQNRYPARSDASTVKQQQQHRHQLPYQQHPSSAAGAGTLTQHTTRSTQRYESKAPASTGPGACNTQSRSSPQSGASNLTIVCKVYVQNIGWGTQLSNGEVMVQFLDGSELSIQLTPMTIWFTDQKGQKHRYGESDELPLQIRTKLETLPVIMNKLESAQTNHST